MILITGGTGFLGAYFTRYALTEGAEARVVVLEKYVDAARIADVLDRVTLVEGDISNADTVRAVIETNGVDRIAHFAGILGSPVPGQMISYVQVQTVGLANVLECARVAGVKRVLFASSVAAYGLQDADSLTEDLRLNPQVPYGWSKAWGESLARHYTQELGLDVVSLRFGSTYGFGRAWRGSYSSGMLNVPKAVHYMARLEEAVRGKPIHMPNDDAVADWTYAADAAQAAWIALWADRLPHDVYNVCAEQRRIGDFTHAMREVLPDAQISVAQDERPDRVHPHQDGTRLKRELGFVPRYSLRDGVADYVERVRAYDRSALSGVGARSKLPGANR